MTAARYNPIYPDIKERDVQGESNKIEIPERKTQDYPDLLPDALQTGVGQL